MTVNINIETAWVDWRKHGRPFIRRMASNAFVEPTHTEWGKKTMKQYFHFSAETGELFQIRLDDGSWKNDSKQYVRVGEDGKFLGVSQDEAGREIAAAKLAQAQAEVKS